MKCPKCGHTMIGPAKDFEGVLIEGRIVKQYYHMWSCPFCMELTIRPVNKKPEWRIA